jgi:sugar phosphate isomerase/epimerase
MKLSIVLSTQPASFSALAFTGELQKNIARIKQLGYDGVELAVRDPGLLDAEHLEKMLYDSNLEVPAVGTGQAYGEDGLSFTHADEAIRERAIARVKMHIDFARHFRARVILGLIRGKRTAPVTQHEASEWLREALRECASYARSYDIDLVMEPINRYETNIVNTVAEGLQLIEKVGADNFGLLLDTFHMNIEEPSIEQSIKDAQERLLHFHIADSNRWHPGAGHVDFRQIIDVLDEIDYPGYLSAEILPLPDSDTCAVNTIEFMRNMHR